MSHNITDWDPEDLVAWEAGNKHIARRNLIWSVAAGHIGFSIWSIWSVMVLFMPESVYGFSAGDKVLLGATATLVGACLRIPYTLATATFGGRNWTVFSAFVLLIPTVGTMWLLAHPGLPLWPYLLCAALAGFGGGNFASSMTNINTFYPQRLKAWALGVNAGGGNIGVPAGGQGAAQGSLHAAQIASIGPLLGSLSRVYGGKLASRAMSGALIGFAGAVGALGGVGINLALRQSYLSSGSASSAFWIFLAFYVLASAVTWVMYVRRPVSVPIDTAEPLPDLART
jgi:nitrate/nitrite transporter NarK